MIERMCVRERESENEVHLPFLSATNERCNNNDFLSHHEQSELLSSLLPPDRLACCLVHLDLYRRFCWSSSALTHSDAIQHSAGL